MNFFRTCTLLYKLSKHLMPESPPKNLATKPRGKARKLDSRCANSSPPSAYTTFLLDLFTVSFTLTFSELLPFPTSFCGRAISFPSRGRSTSVKGVLESNERLRRCKTYIIQKI
eukprot:TRINITY_DN7159_c2_g1_i11.p1 TRINITY_DN7159_c2_g1~~TRINITY_DN7159_c2_g1_i11.p1  ORF type:complete len:114 (+),score=6.84 TRINITY_DN7159_c2_g1_i11:259-600(+)